MTPDLDARPELRGLPLRARAKLLMHASRRFLCYPRGVHDRGTLRHALKYRLQVIAVIRRLAASTERNRRR